MQYGLDERRGELVSVSVCGDHQFMLAESDGLTAIPGAVFGPPPPPN